jgi:uncharacterized protein YndB with AHSA1/START domain
VGSPFQFERSWELDVTPQRFWDTISRTDEYNQWWPWLSRFEAEGMTEGARWTAEIQSPLPYALRVELVLVEVVPCERLAVQVSGDLQGTAGLTLTPTETGSAIDVEWQMRPRSRAMQLAAVVARPLLRWSHEWVLARGLDQFRRRALASDERSERDQ